MTAWLTRIGLLLGTTVLGVVLGLWLTEPPPVRLVLDSHVYEVAPGDRAELARGRAARPIDASRRLRDLARRA